MIRLSGRAALCCGAAIAALMSTNVAWAQQKNFDIPSEDGVKAIPEFARQAGVQIVAPADQLRGVRTPALKGVYEVRTALANMLIGTGTAVASDDGQTIILVADQKNADAPGTPSVPAGVVAGADPETVTVSATRVLRADYQAPTPTIAVGTQELHAQAYLNAAGYLNNLPEIVPSGQVNGNSIDIGENRVNLRNLGPLRALILIDGRRVGTTDPLGGVDINTIPTSLVTGIDIVTGGASADWGSDAVAGVVNFHLDSHLRGIKGNIQCGETQYGDGQGCGGGLAFGTTFLHDRLHVVLAGDVLGYAGVATTANRPWANHNWGTVVNPSYVPGNGQYQMIQTPNACYSTMTPGGLITSGPLKGTQFGPGGAISPFTYGTDVGSLLMNGGTCTPLPGRNIPGDAPLHRQIFFSRTSFDLTGDTSIFLETSYAHTSTQIKTINNYDAGTLNISIHNAYLPQQIVNAMVADNITSFAFGREDPELNTPYNKDGSPLIALNTDARYVVGAKGSLGGSWTWDGYAQYSLAHEYSAIFGDRNQVLWANSVNSVINPKTGLPTCVSTLTNPTDGCIPVNLFGGPGTISSAAAAYTSGTATFDTQYTQRVAQLNVQGAPITLPAGEVSVATGVEWRNETLIGTADPVSNASQFRVGDNANINGRYNVIEGYAEAVVPILKDQQFAQRLELSASGRITDYSTSGLVETWKLGLNYSPFSDEFRLRATTSIDIRAPTLYEQFAGPTQNGIGVFDPLTNSTPLAPTYNGGNPSLVPEVARSKIFGAVYSPEWVPGLQTSLDYTDIKISNAITALTAASTVQECLLGITTACTGVIRNGAGVITQVNAFFFNAQGIEVESVDLDASYDKELADIIDGAEGSLNLHLLGTYYGRNDTTTNGVTLNVSGQQGTPQWHGTLGITYNLDPWSTYLFVNYVGSSIANKLDGPFIFNQNHIQERTYLNGMETYTFSGAGSDRIQLYGGIDNILNTAPPITPSGVASAGPTVLPIYDNLGRKYKIGARFSF